MRVDIYRRQEPNDRLSYLAVTAGRPLPDEVVSAQWQVKAKALDLDESDPAAFASYGIHHVADQFRAKGYAITDLAHQPPVTG